MPEVTYKTVMNLSPERIWDFVQDMNNWAPFMTGYQSHEIKTDRHSVWILKGDVGVLSRTVHLDVHITEWNGPERVSFTLEGLNESVNGDGTFTMAPFKPDDEATTVPATSTGVEASVRQGLFKRWLARLFSWFFVRKFGRVERKTLTLDEVEAQASELSFRLRMDAGGPMAPMVNAMLEPALMPAAQDLGDKIAAHLETLHGKAAPDGAGNEASS